MWLFHSSIFKAPVGAKKCLPCSYLGLETDVVVLDVLQTKIEDSARENMILRTELDILKKEMEGEAVMFNMKVTEFQNQFYRVEQEIRSKNAEIERLRTNDCNRCTFS